MIETVRVELNERSYDILVGDRLIEEAGRHLAPILAGARAFIVTDESVAPLHLARLTDVMTAAGIEHEAIVLPAGEATKDFAHLEGLIGQILDRVPERRSVLIALGGGVVGDIAGLAASLVLRGIGFIQIPTTLLAQVDSAVGGKTAINTAHGKNLVGAFYQPQLVLADIATLDTLPRRECLAGYAEIVKYGLIDDPVFFGWLERHGSAVVDGDPAARRKAVVTSCAAKARIVAQDEREQDSRALLNLGHTFGHALEAATGFDAALLHGEAVAVGMVMAFELSAELGLCEPEAPERVRRHLAAVGLPAKPGDIGAQLGTAAELLAFMRQDKKVRDGQITLVLARGIGRAFVTADVAPRAVEALLARALAA